MKAKLPAERGFISPREIAADLGVHPSTVYGWVQARDIGAVFVSDGVIRVRRSEYVRFLEQREQQAKGATRRANVTALEAHRRTQQSARVKRA